MKKIFTILVISAFVLLGSSQAKIGDFQAGGDFGVFNGEGIDTTYGGAVVHYGLLDELDLAFRYEAGSYSGATLSFLTLGGNYYFRDIGTGTKPYITAGGAQIWANVAGWADSTTAFFYGGGITHALNEQFLLNFDFRAYSGSYAGWELNSTNLAIALMMNM